jgi:hypothetical protein
MMCISLEAHESRRKVNNFLFEEITRGFRNFFGSSLDLKSVLLEMRFPCEINLSDNTAPYALDYIIFWEKEWSDIIIIRNTHVSP